MASIREASGALTVSEMASNVSGIGINFSLSPHESPEATAARALSIARARVCKTKAILLPDANLDLERHRRQISRMISSLANSVSLEDAEDEALLILGIRCSCHPRTADRFTHENPAFHQNTNFPTQLEACIQEYCDPPPDTRYQPVASDGVSLGIVHVLRPISLPVYYVERTPDGRSRPTVWIRSEEAKGQGISTRRASPNEIKNLFVQYLRALQPFLDDEEWSYRESVFKNSTCESSYDLIRILTGFLVVDDVEDRAMAVRAFGEIGGLSGTTKTFLAQLLLGMITDDNLVVRRAMEALSRVGEARQANMLLAMIDAMPDSMQRLQAISALGETGDALIIEQLKALQSIYQEEDEIGYAIDHAIARIRQRHDLYTYDVARRSEFQRLISACEYGPAETLLVAHGDDICEQRMQCRWITALVRIAKLLWNAEYETAKKLANTMYAESDTPNGRFEFWKDELGRTILPWEKLGVSYFVLEKLFMAHRLREFVIEVLSFCERLLRLVSQQLGAKFQEKRVSCLDHNWVKDHQEVTTFFLKRGLKPKQQLGRPALLALAECLVGQRPEGTQTSAQLANLAELGKLATSLTELRNALVHEHHGVSIRAIGEPFGSEPKQILSVLRLAYDSFATSPLGINYFDLINTDIRQWLADASAQEWIGYPAVVIPHSWETSPGSNMGTVERFINESGYGFIRPDSEGDEIFVHITDVIDCDVPNPGQRVAYDVETTDRGPKAIRVTVLGTNAVA